MKTSALCIAATLLVVNPAAAETTSPGAGTDAKAPSASTAPQAQVPPMAPMTIPPGTQWPNPWQGAQPGAGGTWTNPWQSGGGAWQGQWGQGQGYPGGMGGGMGCGKMGGMGGMTSGGMMGGMGGMGMGSMGMGGMMPGAMMAPGVTQPFPAAAPPPGQGLGMNMGQGTTIQDLVRLVTLQEVFEALLEVSSIQERLVAGSKSPEAEKLARDIQAVKERVKELMKENRSQISGGSRGE